MKVAIYIRESGSRQYKPASPRAAYSPNTTFCLRYSQDGKRKWEQLDVKSYKEAQAASLKKLTELITDSCKQKPDVGTVISRNLDCPAPRPAKPVQPTGQLMLDTAIDKYIDTCRRSPRRLRVATRILRVRRAVLPGKIPGNSPAV